MTKDKIKKEYRLAMFRSQFALTYRERNRWQQEANKLRREYETYDDWEDVPLPINYNLNPRKSVIKRDILASKSIEQLKSMISHYQTIVDSRKLVGQVYCGARPHNILREHIAKLKAVIESRTTSSSS